MKIGRTARAAALAVVLAASVLAVMTHAAEARSFAWKVSRAGQTVYIVGSVHMLSKDYYPLPPALDTVYKESDLLVEEADLGEMLSADGQMSMLTRGMLPDDQSLEKVISPATYADVSKRLQAAGMPMEPFSRLKPWAIALMLLGLEWQRAGFDPNLGLDKHFYDRAQSDGKPVQGLETAEFQISRFDEMTYEQQDRMLRETLKEADTEQTSVRTLADAWRAGDAPAVERIVLQDLKSDPQMYQRLLIDRNRNWMPKIEALFSRSGRSLVIVGAAHVVGPDGLLAMLKTRGYAIEQMP